MKMEGQMSIFDLTGEEDNGTVSTNERTNERTIRYAHCLFEQSGTFKNEFIKLGIQAFDYDILNKYNETDYQIDLYLEIEKAYEGQSSIFDSFNKSDIIMAFFPCVRFENQVMLHFRGQSHGMEKWTYKKKMIRDMELLSELKHNYDLVNKLFIICFDRGLRLIMENPYSKEHFLVRYWCLPASVIDRDRRENGDFLRKPTQYWFVNEEPHNNYLNDSAEYRALEISNDAIRLMKKEHWDIMGANNRQEARSMIHPQYANRFIRRYIL